MSSKFHQSFVLATANLKSLNRRIWISASMIASIALVVVVLVGFLAMARGFEMALEGAGSDRVVVVLAGGARDEQGSSISPAVLHQVAAMPQALGMRTVSEIPQISRELVVPVDAPLKSNGEMQTISLRGLSQIGVALRQNVSISKGRFARPGSAELVVGAEITRRYAGFDLGQIVEFGSTRWTVVGHFDAAGSAFESEVWAHISAVQALFKKEGQIQSLRIGLEPQASLPALTQYLQEVVTTPIRVVTEKKYFLAQSQRMSRLIRLFGWPIAIVMAIGATCGALNTMLSSISDRSVEIATLRVIGYSGIAAFIGTWVEAMILTVIGTFLGIAVSFVVFTGYSASTQAGGGQIAFDLQITWQIVAQASLLAFVVGLIGGALPAIQAARMPLLKAMRAT